MKPRILNSFAISAVFLTLQNIVLFQIRRNAETFNPLVTSPLEILAYPDSCLIPPGIQQRPLQQLDEQYVTLTAKVIDPRPR